MCAASKPLRVVLELCPHAGHRGLLTIEYDVVSVRTKVRAHLAKLVLFLARAWHADTGASERFRGLRSAEYIAAHWKLLPDSSTISASTVRAYVKRLRKLVHEAVAAVAQSIGRALAVPELILGENGYRLGRHRAQVVGVRLDSPPSEEHDLPSAGPIDTAKERANLEDMPDARAQLEPQQGALEQHHDARGSESRASGDLYFLDGRAEEPVRIAQGTSVLALELGRACLWPLVARGVPRRPAAGTALIETIAGRYGDLPGLALVPGPGCDLRLNAEPAPCLAWARPGDELWLAGVALRLVLRRGPYLGPPKAEHLGRPCGLCRAPFTAATRVWACPQPACGTVLHLEGPDAPAETRLDCAQLGDCPGCGMAVTTEPTWIGGTPARRLEGEA